MTRLMPFGRDCGMATIVALLSVAFVGQSSAQCQYEVIHIIKAPMCGESASHTSPTALNNHGQACGWFNPCPGAPSRPWVWYGPGDFRVLTPPGGTEGSANDIADDGTVVGYFYLANGPRRGFIYHPGTNSYTVLPPGQPNGWCQATAINAKGQVVGDRSLTNDPTLYQAFIWERGVFTNLGVMNGPRSSAMDIADNETVTGWTGPVANNQSRGFVLTAGQLEILPVLPPNGFSSVGQGVNERATVVGYGSMPFDRSGNCTRAVAKIYGQWLNLGALEGFKNSFALSVNEANEIVGSSRGLGASINFERPTLWRAGQIFDLTEWQVPHANVDYVSDAYAINDDGELLLGGDDGIGDTVAMIARPLIKSPADLSHDCRVDVDDLLLVIGHWGPGDSWTDITKDGIVNVADLIVVIQDWG